MERLDWFCIDCQTLVELNRHGYCGKCGSDAVVRDMCQYERRLRGHEQARIDMLELWSSDGED
jgi:hypothetical protein